MNLVRLAFARILLAMLMALTVGHAAAHAAVSQQNLPPISKDAISTPNAILGMPEQDFVIINDATRAEMAATFARGRVLGNNPRAFSKIGDSTVEHPFFLAQFEILPVRLGAYSYLTQTLDYYSGSFKRDSLASFRGLASGGVFDPSWSNPKLCRRNEAPLPCELRLNKPSVVIIRLGTNDGNTPAKYEQHMRRLLDYLLNNGVVPILSTKADRFEKPADAFNTVIRKLANEYAVPLWDFDRVASLLPNHGLGQDNVHLSFIGVRDWARPETFSRGHGLQELSGLMALDVVRQELAEASARVPAQPWPTYGQPQTQWLWFD